MCKILWAKLKEAFWAISPVTLLIYLLLWALIPASTADLIKLAISAGLLIIGMTLFTLGADNSMQELGENVGATMSQSKKVWLMVLCSFIIGFIITFAEPDLMVLANQVIQYSSLNSAFFFIAMVSLGVGIFLLLAVLKIICRLNLPILLTIVYGLIFILAFFVPQTFMPIAFDAGSMTTGPISVPFIISFGLGIAAVRSGKNEDDSFGLIALCSAGPILVVMIMGLFLDANVPVDTAVAASATNIWAELGQAFLHYLGQVALVLLPLIILFMVFQCSAFKFGYRKVMKMGVGFLYTYVGIVLFLTGVECGYLPIASVIGQGVGQWTSRWAALPLGLVLGAFAVIAEPALHVLKKQVEDITGGVIKQKVIVLVMAIGVACSVMLAVMMALFAFNLLWVLVPVYVLAIALSFFNSKLFTAVAFDAGGVATGAMAVSFILPMVTDLRAGAANGFGTIALIAAFPILTMQILGAIYKIVLLRRQQAPKTSRRQKITIIDYDWESNYYQLSQQRRKK